MAIHSGIIPPSHEILRISVSGPLGWVIPGSGVLEPGAVVSGTLGSVPGLVVGSPHAASSDVRVGTARPPRAREARSRRRLQTVGT
jgi:hypothetical protein